MIICCTRTFWQPQHKQLSGFRPTDNAETLVFVLVALLARTIAKLYLDSRRQVHTGIPDLRSKFWHSGGPKSSDIIGLWYCDETSGDTSGPSVNSQRTNVLVCFTGPVSSWCHNLRVFQGHVFCHQRADARPAQPTSLSGADEQSWELVASAYRISENNARLRLLQICTSTLWHLLRSSVAAQASSASQPHNRTSG
jgi:hypothetical protein